VFQIQAAEYEGSYLTFKSALMTWYRPTCLSDLLELKQAQPSAPLVVGNTELGLFDSLLTK